MTVDVQKIEAELLALPVESRTYLAERLVESLDVNPDPEVEVAWAREIEKRIHEIDSGKVTLIPAETAFAQARKKLHEARRLSS